MRMRMRKWSKTDRGELIVIRGDVVGVVVLVVQKFAHGCLITKSQDRSPRTPNREDFGNSSVDWEVVQSDRRYIHGARVTLSTSRED